MKIMLYLIEIDRLIGSTLSEEQARDVAESCPHLYIYFFIEDK